MDPVRSSSSPEPEPVPVCALSCYPRFLGVVEGDCIDGLGEVTVDRKKVCPENSMCSSIGYLCTASRRGRFRCETSRAWWALEDLARLWIFARDLVTIVEART